MTVQLRFFSSLKTLLKKSEEELRLEFPQSARSIFEGLFDDKELAARLLRSTRCAINCEYVSEETVVKHGDELAFIPPVSGG